MPKTEGDPRVRLREAIQSARAFSLSNNVMILARAAESVLELHEYRSIPRVQGPLTVVICSGCTIKARTSVYWPCPELRRIVDGEE